MAKPKKGALHQILVPMVDATDFASIESGITESDFNSGVTKKFYGVNTGGSAATTSGTISKAGSLVRSGVFRITLKASENNYDQMMVRLNKTGCAEQVIVWENVDNDDSDILSALTVIQSMASDAASAAQQANSRVLVVQSMASDAHSAAILGASHASDAYSAALLIQSRLSDFDSRTVSDLSDLLSAVNVGNSRVLLNQSRISDIASFLVVMSGVQSDIYSALSDFQSDFGSRVPKRVATDSQLSDVHSDLASKIAGITASVSASDISDIASAVWAHTIGARVDSRVLLNLSRISDVYSAVIAGVPLDASTMSDLRSAIAAGPAATITASDISDIASAVWANTIGARVDSRVLLNLSRISDVQSHLVAGVPLDASTLSDLRSAITATELDASDLSDIASAVWGAKYTGHSAASSFGSLFSDVYSRVVVVQSAASDAASAAQQGNSRVLLVLSHASDTYSLLSDLQSDFQSRVPKRVATDSQISDLHSDLRSLAAANHSVTSDIYSLLSDLHSDVAVLSGVVSDVYSLMAAGAPLGASDLSDIRSAITANGVLRAGADPTAVVGVTDTLAAKVDWLTALSRNRIDQTATQQKLHNDALSQIASAAVSDDGTTFRRDEWAG